MTDFDDLMIKIPIETAVLFLGQKYDDGRMFEAMNGKYRQIALEGGAALKYPEAVERFINYCEENPKEKNDVISSINAAETNMHDERFETLISLKWSGIVTSLMHTMPGFGALCSVVRSAEVRTDYFGKKNPKLTYLFGQAGNEQANIPLSYEEQMKAEASKDRIWQQIVDRIKLRGILVVDGWDPQYDWIKERDFSAFISCPQRSVFFFNLSAETKKKPQIKLLISKGIAVVIEGDLCDWIQVNIKECHQYYYEIDDNDSVEITLDSLHDTAEHSVRGLEFNILNQLDKSIYVLDDSILDNPEYLDTIEYFMRFLSTENSEPLWGGYASGFYFKRDIDDELFEKVDRQLKNNDPVKNKIIVLEGRNASGKSASLGNLAFNLRKQRRYPVIYITSEMRDQRYFNQLFNLIRNHINEKLGARKTVVIWDRNTYDNDDLYHDLLKYLEECNVVVVGSRYMIDDRREKKRNVDVVSLPDELSSEREMPLLREALNVVTPEYANHFDEIVQTIEGISGNLSQNRTKQALKTYSDKGNWFLMIMYRLFEDLHKIQRASVKQETQSEKTNFINWLKDYSIEKFSENSFAKLYDVLGYEPSDRLEEYKEFVSEMYNMIAVAGKYGLELPAMVIYRAYEESYADDWGEFSARMECSSVIEMVQYEDAVITFRFRRSLMASLFLEEQVWESSGIAENELVNIEVRSLLKIIQNTNFDDISENEDSFSESMQVLNLIRKFGPNGPEPMRYKTHFLKLADAINKSNEDANDEAILVASHIIREGFTGDPFDSKQNGILLMARAKLIKAINKHGHYSRAQQLSRLKVELCANLLRSIKVDGQLTQMEWDIFDQINIYIDDAMAIDLNRFSAGVFFDTNLKVYPLLTNEGQRNKVLSRMLQIVDDVNDAPYGDFGGSIHNRMLAVWNFAKCYKEIEAENERLIAEGSDVGIYRKAMIEIGNYCFAQNPNEEDMNSIRNAIKILDEYPAIVRNNPRSLYLYIRLLWVSMTGKMPFMEKQFVSLSNEEWKKISFFCRTYITTDGAQKKALPYFINMINSFREGNVKEYKNMVNIARDFRRMMPAYVTFVILCDEKGTPVKENIKIVRNKNRSEVYSAVFDNTFYKGVEAYFKASNFKNVLKIVDGQPIKNALIGFNMYGVLVYGESDLKSQLGGQNL